MNAEPEIDLIELAREECLVLLRAFSVGRFAIASASGSVLVVPVNYLVDEDVIVFRSDPGEKLDHLHAQPASFQIDFVDPFHHTGWSVLVRGTAYRATDAEVGHLDIKPWARGDKPHWVRVVPLEITGRRLVTPQLPLDLRGYRDERSHRTRGPVLGRVHCEALSGLCRARRARSWRDALTSSP